MAGFRKPGPQCQVPSPVHTHDGTSACTPMPPPGWVAFPAVVWHCGARYCPGHTRPEHRCQGVWLVGRRSSCPGHGDADEPCPGLSGPARGRQTVPGLGARKRAVLDAGGTVLDLAVAMLETEDMTTNYPLGDVDDKGNPKTHDAANFGIFKQNWLMIRTAWGPYAGRGPDDYLTGVALNNDLSLDVAVLHASQDHYKLNGLWFAGHRNGATGLGTPDTPDINGYREAVYWIEDQIRRRAKYRTDDTRFWVKVKAI
jgi:hypothetical protein